MQETTSTLVKLTQLLINRFAPLDQLVCALNSTPTGVLENIQKLKNYDVPVELIDGKGYTLTEPLILLDKTEIKKSLKTKSIRLELLERVGSTNEYLKSFYHTNKTTVCLSELQTRGRGRLGRQWQSPFAENISLSLLKRFNKDLLDLPGLSLVVSLALCKAVEQTFPLPEPLQLKWPNDLLCQGKKIAGILVEIQTESNGFCQAIIGVGLNVNMIKDKSELIDQPWTSIRLLNKRYNDRNPLCSTIIEQMLTYLERFEQQGFRDFIPEWNARDALFNQTIELSTSQDNHKGTALGINEKGQLIVKFPDGRYEYFSSGNTRLAKQTPTLPVEV